MPTPPLPKELADETIALVNRALKAGGMPQGISPGKHDVAAITMAAQWAGVPAVTLRSRLRSAKHLYKIEPDWSLFNADTHAVMSGLRDELRTLRTQLISQKKDDLTREAIRKHIFDLKDSTPEPPRWTIKRSAPKNTGIPTMFCSDWHWGEVVNPDEILGANEFNLEIAHKRVRKMTETALTLLFDHLSGANYDGLVLALGGDMVTGDIHEELTNTNDAPIMPTVVDLYGVLIALIDEFLKHFKKIHIPAVTGNHGRNTRKIQMKERAATNFDWLLYSLLQKHYAKDERVTFNIPTGSDCRCQVYDHRYLLTHGDQFRGGDGLIGPLGPITRGKHKKATRDATLHHQFDTMIVGHFHQLMQLFHLIVNGSIKGMDEYAFQNNFAYERPSQALWITHPRHGITIQMPVYCDESKVGIA